MIPFCRYLWVAWPVDIDGNGSDGSDGFEDEG